MRQTSPSVPPIDSAGKLNHPSLRSPGSFGIVSPTTRPGHQIETMWLDVVRPIGRCAFQKPGRGSLLPIDPGDVALQPSQPTVVLSHRLRRGTRESCETCFDAMWLR